MAFAESILPSQRSRILQDSISLLPSVHFPLSSYSRCFQQSSKAEKEVKAEVCILLPKGSWREGRHHSTSCHISPGSPSHRPLEGASCRCLGAGGYFTVGPETDSSGESSFVLLQVVLKSHRTWGFALAWCQVWYFSHTEGDT